jgi:hypothetical protein
MSQISKATQSSESDTDFIQDNTINSVYGDSLGSENDTPAKAKRGLNKILSVGRSTDDLLTTNMINMNMFVLKEVVRLE